MKFSSQVTGGRELGARLIGLGRAMSRPGPQQPLEEAVLAGGRIIAGRAQELAPRSIGAPSVGKEHAADTIMPRITASRNGYAEAHIGPGRRHFYLMFWEIGHEGRDGKVRKQPHLQPALDEKAQAAADEMGRVWREGINNYVRRTERRTA